MPKATDEPTTQAAAPDLSAAIERMRQIAIEAGDHLLLGDGPPHPDHVLLDLCSEAVRLKRIAEKDLEAWRATFAPGPVSNNRQFVAMRASDKAFNRALFHAKKYPAKTPAGIYAKAMLVRSSRTGASMLAMSLADDLLSMPGLRASLWPAIPAAEGVAP